jgi:ParB family chromosome partitioning protein
MTFIPHAFPLETIPMDRIRWDDTLFALRVERPDDPADLRASLERVGMLHPPLVRAIGQGDFQIVCGFARLWVWRAMGQPDVRVAIASEAVSPADLLRIAIEENRTSRGLNPAEEALALEKLSAYLPRETLVGEVLPQLGRKPAEVILDRLLGWRRLPEAVWRALARGEIAESALDHLKPFAPDDQATAIRCGAALRLSSGATRDFCRQAFDVTQRDGVTLDQLTRELGWDPAVEPDPADLPALRTRFLDALRRRRWPVLTRLEATYADRHRALQLPGTIRLRPPKDFEGSDWRLEASFANPTDLRQAIELLLNRLDTRNPEIQGLFDLPVEKPMEDGRIPVERNRNRI